MTGYMLRNKPNFFILGAAKAGTTSLYAMLRQHPQIFMSRDKETQFFFNNEKYSKGVSWYLKTYFTDAEHCPLRGEASPSYLHAPMVVAPRMCDVLDTEKLRFVVILRDPVQRAYSHYLHRRRVGAECESFANALKLEEARLLNNPSHWVGYFRDGLYAKLLKSWFSFFDKEQFAFMSYNKFIENPEDAVCDLCERLGVTASDSRWNQHALNRAGVPRSRLFMKLLSRPPPRLKRFVKSSLTNDQISRIRGILRRYNTKVQAPAPMDRDVECMLRKNYLPDIEELEKLIGQDFSCWKA